MSVDDEFNAKFGEQAIPIGGSHGGVLHVGGPELTIEVGGRVFTFEWHSYCGPIPLNKNGSSKDLPPKSPFWHAVTCWDRQGKRLDDNRRALWEEPPQEGFSDHVKVGRNLVTAVRQHQQELDSEGCADWGPVRATLSALDQPSQLEPVGERASAFTFEEQKAQFRQFAADMDPGSDPPPVSDSGETVVGSGS